MIVALFGSTGHMGLATLKEFLLMPEITKIRVLLRSDSPRNKPILKLAKKNKDKLDIYYGNISCKEDIERIVNGSNYLFNLAAIIPPLSDKNPKLSYQVNELGTYNIVDVLENHPEVKFISISSIAVYGHRNEKHPFNRVGDPLIPSVYDVYSVHKMRGEFKILESNINNFVIIRQTAMIYLSMLVDNMNDGLIFHTDYNNPLEWSTAEDSARVMTAIIKQDNLGKLTKDNFWNKIFNLGDIEENRVSGYKVLEDGFKLMGAKVEQFYKPNDNVTRNFHGGFYYDSEDLFSLLDVKHDSLCEYWKRIKHKYPYFALGRIVPKKLLRKFVIERLYKDPDSPKYWYDHNDIARLTAFFGSKEDYEALPSDWKEFKKWDYLSSRSISTYQPIDYGYDINKSDKYITFEDLVSYASKRGGRLISQDYQKGNIYQVLEWENSDKERFKARAYTVIRGGHWLNPLYNLYTWDFDRLSKKDEIIAAYWYDSHSKDENHTYYMNDKFEVLLK